MNNTQNLNVEALINESRERRAQWLAAQTLPAQRDYVQWENNNFERSDYGYYLQHGLKLHFCCVCTRCGRLASSSYTDHYKKLIESQRLCFHCVHGDEQAARYDFASHKNLIIDAHPYSDAGNRPKATPQEKSMMGHGAAKFIITHLQDGKTWETNNLYAGTVILQYWRPRMPDNAVFGPEIPADTYR